MMKSFLMGSAQQLHNFIWQREEGKWREFQGERGKQSQTLLAFAVRLSCQFPWRCYWLARRRKNRSAIALFDDEIPSEREWSDDEGEKADHKLQLGETS